MKNFIYFTDPHLRLSSPRRRTDDIFEAQLAKLEWIGKRAEELKSECIVCGGDIGDAWDWKISMINRVAKIFKAYTCPLWTIVGNHDVPGKNINLLPDTGISMLEEVGALRILDNFPDNANYWTHDEEGPFAFVGFHSDIKQTDDLLSGKPFYFTTSLGCLKIAIVHAPIGAETTPYCRGHKELFITDFDIVLLGDIHDGWEPYESLTGCKIANPGSLTRLNKKDIFREPKIAVIWEDGRIEYEVVPHKKPEECFDLAGIEEQKQDLGKGFLAAIAARNLVQDKDPKEYVEKIGKAAGYNDNIIEILKNEIT